MRPIRSRTDRSNSTRHASLAFVGYFYEEYDAYQTCVGRAITDSASDACRAEFERSVRERVGLTP